MLSLTLIDTVNYVSIIYIVTMVEGVITGFSVGTELTNIRKTNSSSWVELHNYNTGNFYNL